MAWNDQKSIKLTKGCIIIFALAYLAVIVSCPQLIKRFVTYSYTARKISAAYFMATVYASAVPLGIILWNLYRLVGRIGEESIFTAGNIKRLRLISWMCFSVALICAISAFYYEFFLIIAACSAFMGLLIRVIKNVFVRAKELKEENDYTI